MKLPKHVTIVILTLALLLSVVVLTGVASATHGQGDGPKHDFASGTTGVFEHEFGQVPFRTQVHVNAKSGPAGEDPQGHFFAREESGGPRFDISGEVTCLSVSGNIATVGGEIKNSKAEFPLTLEGTGVMIAAIDNGPGAQDETGVLFTPVAPTRFCSVVPGLTYQERGNFIVHDATP